MQRALKQRWEVSVGKEWCEHVRSRYTHPGQYFVFNEPQGQATLVTDLWKTCPICGTPRPSEPKFIPSAKLDENNDLIVYGKNKAWKFDGEAFRRIVNDASPCSEPKKGLAEKLRDCMLQSPSFMESERYQIQAKTAISHVLGVVESIPTFYKDGIASGTCLTAGSFKCLLINKLKEEGEG